MARANEGEQGGMSRSHFRAFDSKMSVLAQRLKIIEKNERILAKTVTRNNKRIKKLREKVEDLINKGVTTSNINQEGLEDKEVSFEGLEEIKEGLKELRDEVKDNKRMMRDFEDKLSEVQYVMDTLNPVEYLTSKEIVRLVDEEISKKIKKDSKN